AEQLGLLVLVPPAVVPEDGAHGPVSAAVRASLAGGARRRKAGAARRLLWSGKVASRSEPAGSPPDDGPARDGCCRSDRAAGDEGSSGQGAPRRAHQKPYRKLTRKLWLLYSVSKSLPASFSNSGSVVANHR